MISVSMNAEIALFTLGKASRLLFLTHSTSFSSMFGKNKCPMLLFAQLLSNIMRISVSDEKTLSVDFSGAYLNLNFKDKVASQWHDKITEILK